MSVGGRELGGTELGWSTRAALRVALTITIAGVDRTGYYRPGTLTIRSQLNGRTTASLELVDVTGAASRAYTIIVGDPVEIVNTWGLLFSGTIEELYETVPGHTNAPAVVYSLRLVDWTAIADRRYVADEWVDAGDPVTQTAGDIVRELWTDHLAPEGITLGTVEDGPLVDHMTAAYQTVSQCLDRLADLGADGYVWYIDAAKSLNYHGRDAYPCPLEVTPAAAPIRDLRVTRRRAGYRNRQIVIGGTCPSEERTETFTADGSERTYSLTLPLNAKPTITVDGVDVDPLDIGTKGDELTPWLYDIGDPEVERAQDITRGASKTWDPGSIAAGGSVTTTIPVGGVSPGDLVTAQHDPVDSHADLWLAGWVSTAGVVTVRARNLGAGSVDPDSATLSVRVGRDKETIAPVATGSIVAITYSGQVPVVAVRDDPASRAARAAIEGGEALYEVREVEESLSTTVAARAYAQNLLDTHATIPVELDFAVDRAGIRAGQLLSLEVTELGLAGTYLLDSVTLRDLGGSEGDDYLRATIRASDGARIAESLKFFRRLVLGSRPFSLVQGSSVLTALAEVGDIALSDTAVDDPSDQTSAWSADDYTVWIVGSPVRLPRVITVGSESRAVGPRAGAPDNP